MTDTATIPEIFVEPFLPIRIIKLTPERLEAYRRAFQQTAQDIAKETPKKKPVTMQYQQGFYSVS